MENLPPSFGPPRLVVGDTRPQCGTHALFPATGDTRPQSGTHAPSRFEGLRFDFGRFLDFILEVSDDNLGIRLLLENLRLLLENLLLQFRLLLENLPFRSILLASGSGWAGGVTRSAKNLMRTPRGSSRMRATEREAHDLPLKQLIFYILTHQATPLPS